MKTLRVFLSFMAERVFADAGTIIVDAHYNQGRCKNIQTFSKLRQGSRYKVSETWTHLAYFRFLLNTVSVSTG